MNTVIMDMLIAIKDLDLQGKSAHILAEKALKYAKRNKGLIIFCTGVTIKCILACNRKINKLEKRVTELEYKLADPEDIEDSIKIES